jgi:nucleoside-diphosphate-sugar epimerase
MTDKVLLTGISGWIAKHTAIELLNAGYEVLGTVRNNTLIEQTKETISKHAPIDNLSFVELDLLKDDGWNESAKDCKYIIHTASPYPMKSSKDREALVPAAKGGTLRVLKAGIETNVEKIVLTSSIAAMFKRPNRTNPYSVGENDWSDTEWSGSNDYIISKTKAEKAAWDLMESKGMKDKLTVINPGGVNGDALDDKENTSTKYIQLFLKGKYPMAPNFGILISDVKDVAKAHVLSLKNSKVNGRRLLIGSEVKKMLEISKIMQEEFPQYAKKLPKKEMPNFMLKLISYLDSSAKLMVPELGILMQTDTSYAEGLLGIKFKPARDSIKDAGNSLIRLGLI